MNTAKVSPKIKQVPWFSLDEWHQVYKEIYSNDEQQQMKGYETLLIWKSRMKVLPVGVECTLSLIQVCLRDREWSPKIISGELSISYEYDLCLMYSTTIMRFLNRITNIGQKNIINLYKVAKKLNIPDWIVRLRHEAAHGDSLPPIGVLRNAVNHLLIWLHDEYWTANSEAFDNRIRSPQSPETEDVSSDEQLVDLVELWLSLGIYKEAGFNYVNDLQDDHLQNTLNEFNVNTKKVCNRGENTTENHIPTIQSKLLNEIYKNSQDPDEALKILNFLFESDIFLPTPDFIELFGKKRNAINKSEIHLPRRLISFWNHFLMLIHERKLLDRLVFKLIEIVNSPNEIRDKRLYAALWIKTIMEGLLKLKLGHKEAQISEHSSKDEKLTLEKINQTILKKVILKNPELKHSVWFNIKTDIPPVFLKINFVQDILINFNEFTTKFIKPAILLIEESIGKNRTNQLLGLISIYTGKNKKKSKEINSDNIEKIHTVDELSSEIEMEVNHENEDSIPDLLDKTERNTKWELASNEHNWNCPIGILPWQTSHSALKFVEGDKNIPVTILNIPDVYNTIPGILDSKKLKMINRANWHEILTNNKELKRKHNNDCDVIINKAIETIKTKKN